jgi:hypothetical protein
MGLMEVQEELKAKIAEAEKLEAEEVEKVEEPVVEAPVKEEEKPVEEKPAEPEKTVEVEVKKTPAEYAKERRDARALSEQLTLANARIAEANARIAELSQPKREVSIDVEPDRSVDPQAHLEWKLRRADEKIAQTEAKLEKVGKWTEEQERQKQSDNMRMRAEQEVQNYEAVVRQQQPDYDQVKGWYANMLAASMKIVNPKITNDALVRAVNDRLMHRASELLNEGHDNPIAALYHEAKSLGYHPQAASDSSKEVKPDLAKVAANRARNAGTAAAQGDNGRGELTPTVAAKLTNKEFAKLKPAEKQRLFQQLQQAG